MATIRQSGRSGPKPIKPLPLDGAGINLKTKKDTFVYWTVSGEKRSASANTSGRVQFDPPLRNIAQAVGGLDAYTVEGAYLRMVGEAEEIQEEMQAEAPWEDRGGTARESLFARVTRSKNKIALVAGYDVDFLMAFQVKDRNAGTWPRNYSVFLETMQNGRFAIVGPTLEGRYGGFMGTFHAMWQEGNPINEGFNRRRQRQAQQSFQKARLAQLRGR